jgi:hypothetical protein
MESEVQRTELNAIRYLETELNAIRDLKTELNAIRDLKTELNAIRDLRRQRSQEVVTALRPYLARIRLQPTACAITPLRYVAA